MSKTNPTGIPIVENSVLENGTGVHSTVKYGRRRADKNPITLFWRHLVSVSLGITAVGVLSWYILKTIFVTREEYVANSQSRAVLESSIIQTMTQVKETLATQTAAFKEQSQTIGDIKIEIATIKASRAKK